MAGYRPDQSSQTLTMAAEDNEIIFYYSAKTDETSYTVRYLIAEGETGAGTAVAEEKTVDHVPGDTASVIELAAAVDYETLYAAAPELEGLEFFPDEVEKTLTLTADAERNILTFYYSSFKSAKITVNFVDEDGDPIADPDVQIMKVGKTYTLARTPISGWELDRALEGSATTGTAAASSYKITDANATGLSFTLVYQKKLTVTAKSYSKQYDGSILTMPAELDGQVKVEGLLEGDSLSSISLNYDANKETVGTAVGRLNAGVCVVTPSAAVIEGRSANYYKVRYISGTLEVKKITVTVRVEPDRWVGNVYDGTPARPALPTATRTLRITSSSPTPATSPSTWTRSGT